MSEIDIQRQITDWLTLAGIFWWRVSLGAVKHGGTLKKNPMAGHPDIAGLLPGGRYFTVEVKDKGGRYSQAQLDWALRLQQNGAIYITATSLEEVRERLG